MLPKNTVTIENRYKNNKDEFLKLICVYDPSYDPESESYVFFCCFQPWSLLKDSPLDLPTTLRAISADLAGNLICGSLWVDSLELSRFEYKSNTESQVFESGNNKISAVLFKNIINSPAFIPEAFWLAKSDIWVVCIEIGEKNIIIPYFELLRVLFYQASSRLTNFLFSFLSINSLCRPIIFPKEENSWYGSLYVSSEKLTAPEARLLGGLLFDQALKHIFDLSQTHWLFSNSTHTPATDNTYFSKPAGNFETSILFNANGYNFTHDNNKYFWVNSLEIISSPYNFSELLFHPLQRSTRRSLNTSALPLCSDLLNDNKRVIKLPKLHRCFNNNLKTDKPNCVSYSISKASSRLTQLADLPFPHVICSLPWAVTPIRTKKFYWLDDFLEKQVKQINDKSITKGTVYTNHFSDILTNLKKSNYSIEYLTLNNPNNIFGKEVSVFPINWHSPSPIFLCESSIKACTIASIKLTYGTIFLIQPYPKDNPELIIFCQKQDLSIPNELEWNNIFDVITPIYNSTDFYEFSKTIRNLNWAKVSTNSAFIVVAIPSKMVTEEFCISFSNHILSRFRKRLQFHLASILKYPDGITNEQQRRIIALSANICKAPDSLWLLRISNNWSRRIL